MPGFEGAEREDHDEREAGVRVLDCGCALRGCRPEQRRSRLEDRTRAESSDWLVGNARCIQRIRILATVLLLYVLRKVPRRAIALLRMTSLQTGNG
jgi:hypothetical protein